MTIIISHVHVICVSLHQPLASKPYNFLKRREGGGVEGEPKDRQIQAKMYLVPCWSQNDRDEETP